MLLQVDSLKRVHYRFRKFTALLISPRLINFCSLCVALFSSFSFNDSVHAVSCFCGIKTRFNYSPLKSIITTKKNMKWYSRGIVNFRSVKEIQSGFKILSKGEKYSLWQLLKRFSLRARGGLPRTVCSNSQVIFVTRAQFFIVIKFFNVLNWKLSM